MNEKNPSDVLAGRSAVCSFLFPLYRFVLSVLGTGDFSVLSSKIFWRDTLFWIAFAAFAFLRKKNVGLVVVVLLFTLFGDIAPHLSLYYLLNLSAVLTLFIITSLACIPFVRSKLKTIRIAGYLPAVFIALKYVILILNYRPDLSIEWVSYLLLYLLEVLTFLFLGLWINYRDFGAVSEHNAVPGSESGTSDPQSARESKFYSPTKRRDNKLKFYKVMRDSGMMSSEDYEKIEKKIMGQ